MAIFVWLTLCIVLSARSDVQQLRTYTAADDMTNACSRHKPAGLMGLLLLCPYMCTVWNRRISNQSIDKPSLSAAGKIVCFKNAQKDGRNSSNTRLLPHRKAARSHDIMQACQTRTLDSTKEQSWTWLMAPWACDSGKVATPASCDDDVAVIMHAIGETWQHVRTRRDEWLQYDRLWLL